MNIYIDEKSLDDVIALENYKITKEGDWFVAEDLRRSPTFSLQNRVLGYMGRISVVERKIYVQTI